MTRPKLSTSRGKQLQTRRKTAKQVKAMMTRLLASPKAVMRKPKAQMLMRTKVQTLRPM